MSGLAVAATVQRDEFRLELELVAKPGETVGISGDIGSGKSTALWLLASRLQPTVGTVVVPATSTLLTQMFQVDLAEERTGVENVVDSIRQVDPNEADAEPAARSLLKEIGVADHVVDRLPWTFSGAESQRVALARALAPRPELILLDEPTGALDKRGRAATGEYLATWLAGFDGVAVVASTNVELLGRLADRIVTLP